MKRFRIVFIIAVIVILKFSPIIAGISWTKIKENKSTSTEVKIISSQNDETIVSFNVNAYSLKKVLINGVYSVVADIPEGSKIQIKGAPDLSKLAKSIIIPDSKEMAAEIVASDFIEITDLDIAPSKGVIYRNQDPASIPYTFGSVYSENNFFPATNIQLGTAYIMRDYRGQTITVNPLLYNPVTRVLRIYKNITVRVFPVANSTINVLQRKNQDVKICSDFKRVYENHFLNYKDIASAKYNPVTEEGSMLIICYNGFMSAMQPFVAWKKQKGIQIRIVPIDSIGNNATAIKNFVTNYYNTQGLAFLLLVGDNTQVNTSSTTAGDSDQNYGLLAGTDHYADILVGRFSAETLIDAQVQVSKVVNYEKSLSVSDTWLSNGVGIASDQGTGGEGDLGESDATHMNFIRDTLLHYGYNSVRQIYDPGATAQQLTLALDSGKGIINYVGHGGDFEFVTTGFNITDVNALSNYDKLPFIFSVACVNGNFKSQTCFAEAWLRANRSGKLTGAVATIMSTINQSWASPMCGQDEMDRLTTDAFLTNIKSSFGGITECGVAKMIDNYNTDGEDMADTWTIFGDPSLIVRTKTPQIMIASHDATVFIGSTQMPVNCNVNGALVCFTLHGEIMGTGISNGTSAIINFNSLTLPDTILVTITAQDYVTYIGHVLIVPNNGSFVVCQSNSINDIFANNNQIAEYGENDDLNVTLKNVGVVNSDSVIAILTTSDPYITITQNLHYFGLISNGSSVLANNAYSFSIAGNVPNNHSAVFNLNITDANDSNWYSQIVVPIHAPALNQQYVTLDDTVGNHNHYLDESETVNLKINVLNNSLTLSGNSYCLLTSTSSYVVINSDSVNTGVLAANANIPISFNISVLSGVPIGTYIDFTFTLISGQYSNVMNISLPVGLKIEDWECNGFTHYPWVNNGGNMPWKIDASVKYQGVYAARSGVIGNNKNSILQMTMNVIQDDSVSFFRKVSSEQDYDSLSFFIDADCVRSWSGELSWARVSFPVSAGTHTLKWVYAKDVYMTAGSDAAWLDNIQLPAFNTMTIVDNQNNKNNTELNIFPNPVHTLNNISVSWILPEKITNGELVIVDILGNKLSSYQLQEQNGVKEINPNISAGIYFISLISEGKLLKTERIVVIGDR